MSTKFWSRSLLENVHLEDQKVYRGIILLRILWRWAFRMGSKWNKLRTVS